MTFTMPELAKWDNFYVIVGSAAGALIGLQFVVLSLVAIAIFAPWLAPHDPTRAVAPTFGDPGAPSLAFPMGTAKLCRGRGCIRKSDHCSFEFRPVFVGSSGRSLGFDLRRCGSLGCFGFGWSCVLSGRNSASLDAIRIQAGV